MLVQSGDRSSIPTFLASLYLCGLASINLVQASRYISISMAHPIAIYSTYPNSGQQYSLDDVARIYVCTYIYIKCY